MARIPGTTFHDEDPPKPDVDALQLRVRFYESILTYPVHNGPRCKIAVVNGLTCCNPKCNGIWGTGCWCCHSLRFASEAEPDTMRLHLDLKPYEQPDSYERRAEPIIKALEEYRTKGNLINEPRVELHGRSWTIPEVITEIRNRTDEGRTWVAVGGLVRVALERQHAAEAAGVITGRHE